MNMRYRWEQIRSDIGLGRAGKALVREQYLVLTNQIPALYCTLFLSSVVLAYKVGGTVDWRLAYWYPALVAPIVAVRLLVWLSRRRLPPVGDMMALRKMLRLTTFLSGIIALGLGLWALLLIEAMSGLDRAFVAVFVILGAITCAYCLSSVPMAAYQTLLLATWPPSLALLASGELVMTVIGANLVLVSALVLKLILTHYRQLARIVGARGEILAEKAKVNQLAYRDHLTNLPNRRAFIAQLETQTVGIGDSNGLLVAMIDLDGFKPVNDTFGHATGDLILRQAGERMLAVGGEDAFIARIGGDEFAGLVPGCRTPASANRWAAMVVEAFAEPFSVGRHTVRLSASCGVVFAEERPDFPLDLLKRADIALYEGKRRGRSGVSVFEPQMENQLRRRTGIEQALADSNEVDQIDLHFQPLFDTQSLSIAGFEALARWDHPVMGRIDPSEFIAVAEQAGMMNELGSRLFRKAIGVAASWPDHIRLSFNLSAFELCSGRPAASMLEEMKRQEFPPRRLEIEITETALLGDFDAARREIGALREAGVRIVLDDFGAGYASIGYLREMCFDGVKLDGALIHPIAEDEDALNLLNGVLHLCSAIGATTTAEVVETDAQRDILRTLPVSRMQGYLLGRPMSAHQSMAALAAPSVRFVARAG